MAWLQNLAGKAEDLLNKIDKNAAHVLNETNINPSTIDAQLSNDGLKVETVIMVPDIVNSINKNSSEENVLNVNDDNVKVVNEIVRMCEDDGLILNVKEANTIASLNEIKGPIIDDDEKQENSNFSSKSSSLHNSFIFAEETPNFEERIAKLEHYNQELNEQLLNLRHLYSEVQNENSNLQYQLERTSESFLNAQLEMEQYRARTYRILQEKEKMIGRTDKNSDINENLSSYETLNEEIRKQLEYQIQQNCELGKKLLATSNDLANLQHDYVLLQKTNQESNKRYQESIANERKFRITAEDECRTKTKELQETHQELSELEERLKFKNDEIAHLKEQLKQNINSNNSSDLEQRIISLTQTLLGKQTSLEAVMTERNALRLQLEKFENEHQQLLQTQKLQAKYGNINDTDDAKSQLPQLMSVSPLDAGVTRRVKHAYSALDAISIRSGVFLRRYPVARVFVFCYMILLHLWVLIILSTYIPNNRQ